MFHGRLAGVVVLVVLLLGPGGRSPPVAAQGPTRPAPPAGASRPEPPADARLVSFAGPPAAPQELRGFVYRPAGPGPFPAVLWNHGSEALPGWVPHLARFYVDNGFVFFIPHRRGHGRSPGPSIMDRVRAIPAEMKDRADGERRFLALHEEANLDVQAALAALIRMPEVDPDRIVMSGVSFGGIQTLLTAEKGLGVKAFAAFAPGAMSWRHVPSLGQRLGRAIAAARAPVLVVQAKNDFDLGPSLFLADALRQRGDGSAARVFPPFGASREEGHGWFAVSTEGTAVWGREVLAFFRASLQARPRARTAPGGSSAGR